jgi:hypothetical protein
MLWGPFWLVINPHVPGGEGGGAGGAETPILPPRLLPRLVQGARRGGETQSPLPGRAPHPEQGPRLFPHGDAQPTQEPWATVEELEGMAKGVRLGGPRGVAWAVGWSGGRASYPCSRRRGGETGVRRLGAGLLGKATGEVTRGRRRREKGVGGPRRRGHSGPFLPLRAPGRFPLAQWRAVRLGWGPQSGLADPAAPGASASARRRRGKLSLWA